MKKTRGDAPRCVIVGAGEFSPELLPAKSAGDLWIAADGGIDHLSAMNVSPDLWVGDLDSAKAIPEGLEAVRLPRRKDETDLIAAAGLGLKRGYRNFFLYGALGGKRLSHTLASMQTLAYLHENGACGVLYGAHTEVCYLAGGTQTRLSGIKGFFSLFPAKDETLIGIRGALFNGEELRLSRAFPLGVSNEFTEKETVVSVKEGAAYLVIEKTADD